MADEPLGPDWPTLQRLLRYQPTRDAIAKLPEWVNALARELPAPPDYQQVIGYGLVWRHKKENLSMELAMITKAVRVTTALQGALALSDLGNPTEAYSLLRLARDFTNEMWSIAEAARAGKPNEKQRLFLKQHFAPMPHGPNEVKREQHATRVHATGARQRIDQEFGGNAQERKQVRAFYHAQADMYVHGKYATAMELYDPRTGGFTTGSNPQLVERVRSAISSETLGALQVLSIVAALEKNLPLTTELQDAGTAIKGNDW
jgi:hypothetical protein